MAEGAMRPAGERRALAEAGAVAAGLCVFALCVHRGGVLRALSAGGLLAAASVLVASLRAASAPGELLGLSAWSRRTQVCVLVGAILGLGLGVACRLGYGYSALPPFVGSIGYVAAVVGSTEELVYRGYVQGRLRRWGWLWAAAAAALGHTAYKLALFALPPAGVTVNYWFLGVATFGVGMLLGGLRQASTSVLPPIVLHAVFDIAVYGDRLEAPWWLWS